MYQMARIPVRRDAPGRQVKGAEGFVTLALCAPSVGYGISRVRHFVAADGTRQPQGSSWASRIATTIGMGQASSPASPATAKSPFGWWGSTSRLPGAAFFTQEGSAALDEWLCPGRGQTVRRPDLAAAQLRLPARLHLAPRRQHALFVVVRPAGRGSRGAQFVLPARGRAGGGGVRRHRRGVRASAVAVRTGQGGIVVGARRGRSWPCWSPPPAPIRAR